MPLPSCSTHRATAPSPIITFALLTALALGGCNPDREVLGLDTEPAGPPPELLGSAIQLRVDLSAGVVTVIHPSILEAATNDGSLKPSFALLGVNEVEAHTGPVTRSAVGAFTPNRVRVTFDLTLTNNLENSDLLPSTFPAPPVEQVVAFPFATEPAGLFGLKVRASPDWDGTGASGSGAPHNFFNDAICIALTPPSDCFRWEAFGSEIAAGAAAGPRQVGFDVVPSVTSFTVYVVVAADIHERVTSPAQGGIAGTVNSALEPMADVIVTATPGGAAATNARGFYSISNLAPGAVGVELSNLPVGCSAPPVTATVAAGGVTDVSFNVTCAPPPEPPDSCEPNETRSAPCFLGNLGDGQGVVRTFTFHSTSDLDWYSARLVQQSSCGLFQLNKVYQVRVRMTVPPGKDYDLFVSAGGQNTSSTGGVGADEFVSINLVGEWGVQDEWDLSIEVRNFGGTVGSESYILTVEFELNCS